ncbi:hypothetical protein ASPWEDRAFT_144015 [Aspergillus wentii DTO 134E9]|uniref:Zn(2)-C6 fungal-type domain-containing protein n=1 Tax=Aspergillus wentii DTO 134E9 TaxID=1073089 RepID=A0A1L9R4Y9_ASPWE|nr:uncharacterized protein ASPWEDRAFT_144015 [Aspergillus wentii DTO 134E9]OJJ29953.1 hypothetical protein ASPWEDRAFT_144015 [Aspergillus wentii DTO 134E9]
MLRNRTLTGCGTCRSRHLKCDETRPVCRTCQRLNLVCQGYEPRFKWIDQDQKSPPADESEVKTFRRPLFQSEEQELMTRITADSLGKLTANSALARLENEQFKTADGVDGADFEVFRGPFGVLRMSEMPVDVPVPVPEAVPEPEVDVPEAIDVEEIEAIPEEPLPAEQFNDWEMMWPIHDSAIDSLPLLDDTRTDYPDIFTPFDNPDSFPAYLSPMPFFDLPGTEIIPSQAPFLLRHFKENMISLSFPLRNCRKCPWQTIHLPSAMSTYAELSIYKTASHTKMSLFYSLLAASCFHLSTQAQRSFDWDKLGNTYTELAKQKLKRALKEEVIGPKKARYKELLMALLSLVMLAILNGKDIDAQVLLIDAECLIRMRGLPKPRKSVKLRSLHHVYTYLRIMAESTCGCALLKMRPDRPSSSLFSLESSYLTPRSFRVADYSTDADLDMQLEKSIDMGYNDIHLEVMGTWKETLYPEIYGIPESLMALLSQTIRLANEQDLLHENSTINTDIAMSLNRRAKLLEKPILAWELPHQSQSLDDVLAEGDVGRTSATYYMVLAVHQALILFYYRRIRNIHASILQETVRKTLGYLVQSDQADRGCAIPWPGFLAACEALDPQLQSELAGWLRSTGQRTGLRSFITAAETAERVWRARRDREDYTLSWLEVMNSSQSAIIAS